METTFPTTDWSSLEIEGSLGLAFFACLTGRRDLLPSSVLATNSGSSVVRAKGLSTQLVWRLHRLMESASAHYGPLAEGTDKQNDIRSGVGGAGRHELNQKRCLVTPELKRSVFCQSHYFYVHHAPPTTNLLRVQFLFSLFREPSVVFNASFTLRFIVHTRINFLSFYFKL